MKKGLCIMVALTLLLSFSSVSFAVGETSKVIGPADIVESPEQTTSTEEPLDESHPEKEEMQMEANPGITPESFFYILDKLLEKIQLFLTFSPEKKAELYMEFAQERLAEAAEMVEQENDEQADEVASEYDANMESAEEVVEDLFPTNPEVLELMDQIEAIRAKNESFAATVLARAREKKLPSVPALEKVIRMREARIPLLTAKAAYIQAKAGVEKAEASLEEYKSQLEELKMGLENIPEEEKGTLESQIKELEEKIVQAQENIDAQKTLLDEKEKELVDAHTAFQTAKETIKANFKKDKKLWIAKHKAAKKGLKDPQEDQDVQEPVEDEKDEQDTQVPSIEDEKNQQNTKEPAEEEKKDQDTSITGKDGKKPDKKITAPGKGKTKKDATPAPKVE